MQTALPYAGVKEYAILLAVIAMLSLGIAYAKQLLAFLLTRLYQYFIQGNNF